MVTSSDSFIGSNFVLHMLNKYSDYRIICLDKRIYAGNLSMLAPVMYNPNFRFIKVGICDCGFVNKLFREEQSDIMVNSAAESHVGLIEDSGIFNQTNIIGTAILMDACRKYGIMRYYQVSIDEVYGGPQLDCPDLFFTEEIPIHINSSYNSFKAVEDLQIYIVLVICRCSPDVASTTMARITSCSD